MKLKLELELRLKLKLKLKLTLLHGIDAALVAPIKLIHLVALDCKRSRRCQHLQAVVRIDAEVLHDPPEDLEVGPVRPQPLLRGKTETDNCSENLMIQTQRTLGEIQKAK